MLDEQLQQEQMLLLRLSNTRKPWSLVSATITTVADQGTYTVEQPISSYQYPGKVHYVARATENSDLPYLSVPFDDFPDIEYGELPPTTVNESLTVPERISFYRSGIQGQTFQAVISPTPQEALTYTVWFLTGSLDKSQALMTQTGPLTELADYIDLKAMLQLVGRCRWRDDEQFNATEQARLATGFERKISDYEPIVEKYIQNIDAPASFEMDHWND